ncbi:MAG: MFS transporter [Actinobacteria bacterium]|nr:MFS transporter [Actinomycetota bacterium]
MGARQVVRAYYVLSGLYTLAASLIWGVNTLFLLDAGLSIGEVFVANAVFSAGMVLFEIPTGVVADTLGRRVSYLFSVTVLAATTGLYLLVWSMEGGVVAFSIVSLFMGLGFTFFSGALEAWMVDALNHAGGGDLDQVFARAQQVTGGAMLVGTVGGGFLGQVSLGLPFGLRMVLLLGLIGIATPLMVEQGFTPRPLTRRAFPREMVEQARVALGAGWAQPGLRALILTSAVGGGLMFWAFYAAQPYFLLLLERDAVWIVGVLTAALSVAMMGGNQLVKWLSKRCQRRTTLLLGAAAVIAAATTVMGATDHFAVAAVAFLVLGAAFGVTQPVHSAYVHTVTSSEHRATVVSFDSMVGSTGSVGGQLGLGWVAEARSLAVGYMVAGIASLLALPLLLRVRAVGGAGDRIVGRDTSDASCAAEGLPAIAQIEPQHPEVVETIAGGGRSSTDG